MNGAALRVGSTSEIPLQASKWLDVQVLMDEEEMKTLFDALPSFSLYYCGTVLPKDAEPLPKELFLQSYAEYIDVLKSGGIPDIAHCRKTFSPAMTVADDALYRVLAGPDKQIIRQCRPVVQLQANTISYSAPDGKFHPMAFGADNIAWGIQFSYPQLFLDPTTKEVEAVKETPSFPNTVLFHHIQRWMRGATIPTPFLVDGKGVNVPLRLGKRCLSWINTHAQLKAKGIRVKTPETAA